MPLIHNCVSMSGGKDSTALSLLAIERETENLKFVFADTGHEHPLTYEYVDYLDREFIKRCGVGITRVRADFSAEIEAKRLKIVDEWPALGISAERLQKALDTLKPTGNPFIDLCLVKGMFPSHQAKFCTDYLKQRPMLNQVEMPLLDSGCQAVVVWMGVRAQESASRANLPEKDVEFGQWEPEPQGLLSYRPIIKWSAQDVFDMHKKHGVKPNPLYKKGMYRVGCMPCIFSRKAELRAIAKNFPEVFDHLRDMEATIQTQARKDTPSTFFHVKKVPGIADGRSHAMAVKEWATGGGQLDLVEIAEGAPTCSSVYGLCE